MKNFHFNTAMIIGILVALVGSNAMVCGQNVTSDELVKHAQAVARGEATELQKAVVFASNERLNNLAMAGKIDENVYQANQRAFVEQNDELIRQAATRHDLVVAPSQKSGAYKAGTDTDRQLQRQKGNLSVENVKNVRQEYNKVVSEYLQSQGVKVAAGENWAKKLATDIMPSPYDMKPADFKAANSYINSDGGLAYTSADAAKVELNFGDTSPKSLSLKEAEAYHAEMQKKVTVMDAEIQNLNRKRLKVSDPVELENIEVEIRKHTAFMGKYLDRDNKIADQIEKQTKVEVKNAEIGQNNQLSENSYNHSAQDKLKQAQNRDASRKTQNAEVVVHATNKQLALNANRKFNESIAGAAIASNKTDSAKSIIASNLKNLSLSQQNQEIADLEIKFSREYGLEFGRELAKGVSAELKKNAKTPPQTGRKVTISNSLGLINTVLNVSNQYAEGKTTTSILWDMSIGSTLETVNNETADYTKKEIERLKQEYRDAGEDSESISVKLKIMGKATVKGFFYGSTVGSLELLKSATHTAAGAAYAAADSAIFLVGEALDTRNVLEQTYAEMKAQNMEQSVQNARAVKFGREAINELKRLAAEAVYLKSVLEQNARSARQFCRQSQTGLDNLNAELRQINDLKGLDVVKTLPEAEKRIGKNLSETNKALQPLIQQVGVARKMFASSGDLAAADQTIQTMTAAYHGHLSTLDSCKNEILKLVELSSLSSLSEIFADFENRKVALLEQGRQATVNAELMRKNEAQYKKSLASFDSLKQRIESADTFFAGQRQTNEGDWMVIKSRLGGIIRPDGRMPEAFFGEVGTLERLPETIRNETGQLQLTSGVSPSDLQDAASQARATVERLTILYDTAANSLVTLKEGIDTLHADASKKPELASPVTAGLRCPSVANVGENVSMQISIPVSSPVRQTGSGKISKPFDPYGGHNPDSPEGMLALQNYKRAVESGNVTSYLAQSDDAAAESSGSTGFLINWDYGDGTNSGKTAATKVSHVYQQPGRYVVRVSVYGDGGLVIAADNALINVQKMPATKEPDKKPLAENQNQNDNKRLPCGHLPGECTNALKCRLHSGKISVR